MLLWTRTEEVDDFFFSSFMDEDGGIVKQNSRMLFVFLVAMSMAPLDGGYVDGSGGSIDAVPVLHSAKEPSFPAQEGRSFPVVEQATSLEQRQRDESRADWEARRAGGRQRVSSRLGSETSSEKDDATAVIIPSSAHLPKLLNLDGGASSSEEASRTNRLHRSVSSTAPAQLSHDSGGVPAHDPDQQKEEQQLSAPAVSSRHDLAAPPGRRTTTSKHRVMRKQCVMAAG